MDFKVYKFISKRLSKPAEDRSFLGFVRVVALISITLGSMALIISLSVLQGFEKALFENAVKFNSHITVNAFERKIINNTPEIINNLRRFIHGISSLHPSIERQGLLKSKNTLEAVLIKGYDSKNDITNIKSNLIKGTFEFSDKFSKEIVISKRMSEKLNVSIGDNLILYSMRESPAGNLAYPDIDKFKIIGIYQTGFAKYDDAIVFIPFFTAYRVFQIPENSATSLEIMVSDLNLVQSLSEKIQSVIGYKYYTLTVFEMNSSAFAWIELQKDPIPIVLGLISLVAVSNILTILLITVVEKTRSIGILRALGVTSKDIIKIFIFQGLSIAVIGNLIGCSLALLFTFLQKNFGLINLRGEVYFLDTLPVSIDIWHYITVIIISLTLALISTLIPSYIATKINTIQAIRFK
ncbi:MAG: FtsX-like permease family protein [Candidatus Kapabacteria bacterium]|nr:FtsX-like permease family protein [Candidatus Kapabacteria bacterium]